MSTYFPKVRSQRIRFTTAQVNAGATIIPAIAGARLRLVDCIMIAIGGAASGATTVDILGTQAAASVKLIAAAVAGLTQNTVGRAGATNFAVLAGGASFEPCDAGAGIAIAKTGGSLATATHVDVVIQYMIEAQ